MAVDIGSNAAQVFFAGNASKVMAPQLPPNPPGARIGSNRALADILDENTVEGSLWQTEGDRVRCVACGHRCLIAAGRRGVCKVRFNQADRLRVPYGYVAGLQCDPVEKKPFYHVYPGTDALTFGMLGCDFHCQYCQNWVTSQALHEEASRTLIHKATPEQLVTAGLDANARLIVSSYNEPLITAEWAVAVFRQASAAGLQCAFVSNGNATAEALEFLGPWLVAYKIDLKSFTPQRYRALGGTLDRVLETIRMVHERGLWLEVVTLLIPGFNDDPAELRELTRFIASVSPDIPWHVTAFHPDYKMMDAAGTEATLLIKAAEIGAAQGLRFVYAGNTPGRVGRWENTMCPGCGEVLIERHGYVLCSNRVTTAGACPKCRSVIPGIWDAKPAIQSAADTQTGRMPRSVSL